MLKILVYSCEMSESKKIQITVQEDRSEAKAIRAANRSIPATIQPEPLQNDIITEYIAKYLDKDHSVVPLMVELLRGKDFRLKKILLYAIRNIRYSYDWNFQITEPILIETLFSLRKYKSLEWPLLEVLVDYKFEGYLDVLENWFSSSNTSILSPILMHLTYVGRFDCLRILEKKAAGRLGSQLAWPLLVASLKTIGGRNKTLVVYLEAIVMQLLQSGFYFAERSEVRQCKRRQTQLYAFALSLWNGKSDCID